jgi:tetraacyldisaccharide 4'-kinase
MRAPAFWAKDGLLPVLLTPLSWVWRLGGRFRDARRIDSGVPVIAIGNLVAGGAGKTPLAIAVAQRLISRGRTPHIITRGHGGTTSGPLRVDPAVHDAATVGDEPLLLAAVAPTWVARDRAAGAAAAIAAGADVLVLDDAHQNHALAKALSLLAVDAGYGFGNGRVIPAGPLREPVAAGLARTDAAVLIGDGTVDLGGMPALRGTLQPRDTALAGRRVLAFAGIGRPEKFFATLRELGCDIAETHPFADHHPYTAAEIERLLARAAALDATPVTTAKDHVRLPPPLRAAAAVLSVDLVLADMSALDALLDQVLAP